MSYSRFVKQMINNSKQVWQISLGWYMVVATLWLLMRVMETSVDVSAQEILPETGRTSDFGTRILYPQIKQLGAYHLSLSICQSAKFSAYLNCWSAKGTVYVINIYILLWPSTFRWYRGWPPYDLDLDRVTLEYLPGGAVSQASCFKPYWY